MKNRGSVASSTPFRAPNSPLYQIQVSLSPKRVSGWKGFAIPHLPEDKEDKKVIPGKKIKQT